MENNLVTSCRYKPVIIVPYSRQTVDFHRVGTKTRQNPDRTSESALKSDESFLYIRLRWPENKQKKSDWKHQLVCSRAFIFILIQLEQQLEQQNTRNLTPETTCDRRRCELVLTGLDRFSLLTLFVPAGWSCWERPSVWTCLYMFCWIQLV